MSVRQRFLFYISYHMAIPPSCGLFGNNLDGDPPIRGIFCGLVQRSLNHYISLVGIQWRQLTNTWSTFARNEIIQPYPRNLGHEDKGIWINSKTRTLRRNSLAPFRYSTSLPLPLPLYRTKQHAYDPWDSTGKQVRTWEAGMPREWFSKLSHRWVLSSCPILETKWAVQRKL